MLVTALHSSGTTTDGWLGDWQVNICLLVFGDRKLQVLEEGEKSVEKREKGLRKRRDSEQ